MTDFRAVALSMPPEEAVEYLLQVVEDLTPAPEDDVAAILTGPVRKSEWRLFSVLRRNMGRVYTPEAIIAAMHPGKYDDFPVRVIYAVRRAVYSLRARLPENLQIENVHGLGYRLTERPI